MEKEKQTGPVAAPAGFLQWAMTPPQSYAVYLICLFVVAGLSFYAGSLRPKKVVGMPPAVSAPLN